MHQSKLVLFVMYLYPRYIRRKIALQGVKIGNIFHTYPRCRKSRGHLNVRKICHDVNILGQTLQLFDNRYNLIICTTWLRASKDGCWLVPVYGNRDFNSVGTKTIIDAYKTRYTFVILVYNAAIFYQSI